MRTRQQKVRLNRAGAAPLHKCRIAPAINTLHSIRSASRCSGRDGPKRVIAQNAVAAASMVFSSASQATTRSGCSMLGLVRRSHAFEIARSAADGRSSMGAYRAMICTMNALAMRKAYRTPLPNKRRLSRVPFPRACIAPARGGPRSFPSVAPPSGDGRTPCPTRGGPLYPCVVAV